MLSTVYLNGEYLDQQAARLHVSDLSILRGYGVFDYFRYTGGQPRFVTDHLERFGRSAAGLGLTVPLPTEQLAGVVHQLIERNGGRDGGIRLVLTGGYATDGYSPASPNLLGLPYPFQGPPAALYERGCSVLLHDYERQLPHVKSIDYIEGIRIQPLLRKRGAHYPLYVDRDGNVRESDRSNFMIVRGGVLITPVDDILLGITRDHLLDIAAELDIPLSERAVSVKDLLTADEALICSSVKGVMPITKVDGNAVGGGAAGAITLRLMQAWREHTSTK